MRDLRLRQLRTERCSLVCSQVTVVSVESFLTWYICSPASSPVPALLKEWMFTIPDSQHGLAKCSKMKLVSPHSAPPPPHHHPSTRASMLTIRICIINLLIKSSGAAFLPPRLIPHTSDHRCVICFTFLRVYETCTHPTSGTAGCSQGGNGARFTTGAGPFCAWLQRMEGRVAGKTSEGKKRVSNVSISAQHQLLLQGADEPGNHPADDLTR